MLKPEELAEELCCDCVDKPMDECCCGCLKKAIYNQYNTMRDKLEKTGDIEYITCDSGDWSVLIIPQTGNMTSDFRYENHSIPESVWLDVFKEIGFKINKKCISDDDMENENY